MSKITNNCEYLFNYFREYVPVALRNLHDYSDDIAVESLMTGPATITFYAWYTFNSFEAPRVSYTIGKSDFIYNNRLNMLEKVTKRLDEKLIAQHPLTKGLKNK